MRRLPLIWAAAFLTSSGWAATYTFTGIDYNITTNFSNCLVGTCTNFAVSMKVSGSITVPVPLGANFAFSDITSQISSYSFSDGVTTYTNTDPNSRVYQFAAGTGANGNINLVNIQLQEWQSGSSPHSSGDRYAFIIIVGGNFNHAVNNDRCTAVGASPAGVPDTCGIQSTDTGTSSAFGSSGSWTVSVPTPTLGEWETIFLGGLLVTLALLRLRHQARRTPAA